MAFTGYSPTIQNLLQQNFLVREMEEGLDSVLAYRRLALQEVFPGRIGETMTRTRKGRKPPVTAPMAPYTPMPNSTTSSANATAAGLSAALDNGLSPSNWSIEQYTFTMASYADSIDLNLMQEQAQLADQFIANARNNGVQAAQSLERICRQRLFGAYLSGNSRVITVPAGSVVASGSNANAATIANGATGAINVDDLRGFYTLLVNGAVTAVSASNPLNCTYTAIAGATAGVATPVQVTVAPAAGASNYVYAANKSAADVTTSPDAIPGELTIKNLSGSATITVSAGDVIVSNSAPAIFRPFGRTAMTGITGGDVLSLGIIEDAVAYLRDNGIPPMDDGTYHCILDNTSMRQLFADQDFKVLFAGRSQSTEYRDGELIRLLGVTYVPTTEAYVQNQHSVSNTPTTLTGVKIRRPIIAGAESIIQGNFEGMETWLSSRGFDRNDSNIAMVDGVVQIVREPLDRLQQLVSMTWTWIGDYTVPTDLTATSTIIPTASNALYKRCAVIEHAG